MKLNRYIKIVLVALFVAQNFAAVAQLTNVIAPTEYPKFLARYNIFNPNRQPNVIYVPRPRQQYIAPVVNQIESFTLVGIIGYSEGTMAGVRVFFDGTNPQYHKTAQLNDDIANFRITDIAADSVTLMSDTNTTTVLRIGEQLHNDGVGHWLSANGIAARSTGGYGNGRNTGRGGYGGNTNGNGGRRRNGNFGTGNTGNNNTGNFTRTRNNFGNSASAADNSQAGDQGMDSQDNGTPPDDNAAPDTGAQDNSPAPQTGQSAAPAGDSNDPLAALRAARAAELQQIGR